MSDQEKLEAMRAEAEEHRRRLRNVRARIRRLRRKMQDEKDGVIQQSLPGCEDGTD